MTTSWPLSRQQVLDANGRPYLPVTAEFFVADTTTPLTVYADAELTVPLTQPVAADGTGRFPRIYLPAGLYAERVKGPYGNALWFDDGLGEPVASSTVTPTPTFDPNAMAATGDVKWRLDTAIPPGWVRMNGRTLGGAGSGATELADASAKALFAFLWSAFPDTVASVVGGRGATASADFSAGKQITIPTMQGCVAAGLDDMGSSPAGRIQTITDLTLTAGSTTATVASAARLCEGMTVTATGISAGTTITTIAGTTLTLSQAASAGSTGTVSGRFSMIGDAQAPGQTGGDSIAPLTVDQLPVVTPAGTVGAAGGHAHQVPFNQQAVYAVNGSGGAVITVGQSPASAVGATNAVGDHAHPFAGTPFGGGQAHANLQPTRLGTYYMKT